MAGFDPDAYLQKKRQEGGDTNSVQPFDPDAYLGKSLLGTQEDPDAPKPEHLPIRQDAGSALQYAKETGEGFGRGVQQGATLGFGDEWAGLASAAGGTVGRAIDTVQDFSRLGRMPTLEELGPLMRSMRSQGVNDYREGRDDYRADTDRIREAAPVATFAGEVAGGILPGVLTAGAASPATVGVARGLGTIGGGTGGALMSQAPNLGARILASAGAGGSLGLLSGMGNTNADLTRGSPLDVVQALKDMGTGGLLGGVLGGVAPALSAGAGALVQKGRELQSAAQQRAQALAREAIQKELNSARGALGGATQGLNRTMENIARVEVTPAQQTAGDLGRQLQSAARAAREEADNLMQGLIGRGREDAVEAGGEWLSKGSRLDRAQRAAQRAKQLTDGAARAERQASELLARADDVLSTDDVAAQVNAARQRLMQSPEWSQGNAALLSSQLDEFVPELQRVQAARQAFEAASEQFPQAVQDRAARLVGPQAAGDWAKRVATRYAAPLTGAVLGGQAGGTLGAGIGLATGEGIHALAGLAGAGVRPALQSIRRGVTQNPAVMNASGRLLEMASPTLLQSTPATFATGTSLGRASDADERASERFEMLRRALEEAKTQ